MRTKKPRTDAQRQKDLENHKRWLAKPGNRDALRAKQRAYHRENYVKNADYYKNKTREWLNKGDNRRKALDKLSERRRKRFFHYKSLRLRGENKASGQQLAQTWKKQRGLCALTGVRLRRENAHLDHVMPKARGGTDEASNLRWVCWSVNLARRDMLDAEFVRLCAAVVSHVIASVSSPTFLGSAQSLSKSSSAAVGFLKYSEATKS